MVPETGLEPAVATLSVFETDVSAIPPFRHIWWTVSGLNRGPSDYESAALTN